MGVTTCPFLKVPWNGLADFLRFRQGFERRAVDLNGGPVLTDRTPRGYEARIAVKAGTAAARKADHEREAVTGGIPHLGVFDGSDDAADCASGKSGAKDPLIGVSTRSSR